MVLGGFGGGILYLRSCNLTTYTPAPGTSHKQQLLLPNSTTTTNPNTTTSTRKGQKLCSYNPRARKKQQENETSQPTHPYIPPFFLVRPLSFPSVFIFRACPTLLYLFLIAATYTFHVNLDLSSSSSSSTPFLCQEL